MKSRVLFVFALLIAVPVFAQEQRCNELGTNCTCSMPMQATDYVSLSGTHIGTDIEEDTFAKAVGETNSKPCNQLNPGEHGAGWGIYTYHGWMGASIGSDPSVLNALPNRDPGTMARYLRGPARDHTWEIGHYWQYAGWYNISTVKRMAIRWYLYRSSDYQLPETVSSTGYCTNSKLVYASPHPMATDQSYGFGTYDTLWNLTAAGRPEGWDCCLTGPFGSDARANATYRNPRIMNGVWSRMEYVISNPNSVGWRNQLFITDVTNGGSTRQILDLAAGCTDCVMGSGEDLPPNVVFTPTSPTAALLAAAYHVSDHTSGPYWDGEKYVAVWGYCGGFQAIAYVVVATWDTDAGQMIGAAYEVEGGQGGDPISSGHFSSWSVASFLVFLTISMGVGAVLALVILLWRRGRRYAGTHSPTSDDSREGGLGEPAWTRPVDGPPAEGGYAVQPLVSAPPADELVGVGAEVENRH